jgi:hypothetical protein
MFLIKFQFRHITIWYFIHICTFERKKQKKNKREKREDLNPFDLYKVT